MDDVDKEEKVEDNNCIHYWIYEGEQSMYEDLFIIQRICSKCDADERAIIENNQFKEYDG